MWCANCNKTSYSDVCEVCGGKTQQDTPIELYWCDNCRVPIIREVSDTSPMICPSCGKTIRYLAKDLRPVFPEERLLLEVVKGTPLAFINSSVWASGSRYYNEEGVSELDEQFERLPDGHEAKRSYYLGFRQAQSEARPNIVISLLKLN